jgi:hypothetical protein
MATRNAESTVKPSTQKGFPHCPERARRRISHRLATDPSLPQVDRHGVVLVWPPRLIPRGLSCVTSPPFSAPWP